MSFSLDLNTQRVSQLMTAGGREFQVVRSFADVGASEEHTDNGTVDDCSDQVPSNDIIPSYLAKTLHLTSDIEACRRLRSGSTSTLFVPATRRSSLGDRVFPVAAA